MLCRLLLVNFEWEVFIMFRTIKKLVGDVHRLDWLDVRLGDSYESGVVVQNGSELSCVLDVKDKKYLDPRLEHVWW